MIMFYNENSITWILKYFGLPLSIGYATYHLSSLINKRKRKSLEGQVVVITGASSGIGESLAHVFYNCGCKVVLASRRKSELERVKNDLLSKKSILCMRQLIHHWILNCRTCEPVVLELDLENLDQVEPFVTKVYDKCGHIDILINNGGISHRGSILHTKIEVDKRIMFTNYFGSVALTKAVLPKMVEKRSGHIVFVSSVQGLIAIPDRSAYAATKHALQAFGDCLRAEMSQHNINVSVVSPGYVKTAVSLNALTGNGTSHGVMDKATEIGFTADFVANKILDMVINKDNELIISQFMPRLGIFLRNSMPSTYFWVMAKRANKTV